jgi:alanine dehydrogenase
VVGVEGGRLKAPPRASTDLGDGRLVFTTGALDGEWFGYRSYDTFEVEADEQVVVVQSARTGRVRGIAVGSALGQMRTGALGGLAVDLLARPDAATLGLVGAGAQAWRQVWAIASVRAIEAVTVYARTPDHASAFAARVRHELGLHAESAPSAQAALADRHVVVLATNSRTSVINPTWLAPGTHVTTVGPKQRGAAEFGLELVESADVIATDSLAQLHGYDPPSLVAISQHAGQVRSLGAIATGNATGRRHDDDVTLFLSVGLAGTEVHLLHRALAAGAGGQGSVAAARR